MDNFINIIESSLLSDLVGLYSCDLSRQLHTESQLNCLACAKGKIIEAIVHYRNLDALLRPVPFLSTLIAQGLSPPDTGTQ